MKEIFSRNNKIYKKCKQLQLKKYRDSLGEYLIEGPNLIEEAFKCEALIDCILLRQDYEEFDIDGIDIYRMDSSLFDDIADTKTSQGIMAIAQKIAIAEEDFFEKVGNGNIVILDRLQDPGNIGTIIRTADAAGYRGLIALKGTGDIYSQKTIRAAAGSVFRLPVLFANNQEQVVRLLKKNGKKIFATSFDTENWYYDVDMKNDVALIIGNEGNGISDELISLADKKIKIPMVGNIESLNAAVAAGILMYESIRK